MDFIETKLTGVDLINEPMLNKGTAFSEEERDCFALHGLLPPHVGNLADQIARRLIVFNHLPTNFQRYSFLRDLQDINETLFYALLVSRIEDMLPVVYTPTVGEGCQRFSEVWRKPRGLFLSYPNRNRIAEIFASPRYDGVSCIVVSDGERILGLGDQGAGGMGIPIGKLALYTALGGIHPGKCLPVMLDVGTDNEERLRDPIYIGWRHERIRGAEYDGFIESFISAVEARWPRVLLQWEDFAGSNAARLLARYRDRLCTFNDDIQGTAAVATGALLSAVQVTGVPLEDQRIAIVGFGSAGLGIATLLVAAMQDAGLSAAEARERFFAIDRNGLLVDGETPGILPSQQPFARKRAEVAGWKLREAGRVGLVDVAVNARPTALVGVSGQAGAFSEEAIRAMAEGTERPIVFPLSNPTSRSEAAPDDLLRWTGGRAIIGAGSPFAPVCRDGKQIAIDQTNNSYIFPGVALGIISSGARRVTEPMFMAAAKALAGLSPARSDRNGRLLPPIAELRSVSAAVALAVAEQAQADGVADPVAEDELQTRMRANVWEPRYLPYRSRK